MRMNNCRCVLRTWHSLPCLQLELTCQIQWSLSIQYVACRCYVFDTALFYQKCDCGNVQTDQNVANSVETVLHSNKAVVCLLIAQVFCHWWHKTGRRIATQCVWWCWQLWGCWRVFWWGRWCWWTWSTMRSMFRPGFCRHADPYNQWQKYAPRKTKQLIADFMERTLQDFSSCHRLIGLTYKEYKSLVKEVLPILENLNVSGQTKTNRDSAIPQAIDDEQVLFLTLLWMRQYSIIALLCVIFDMPSSSAKRCIIVLLATLISLTQIPCQGDMRTAWPTCQGSWRCCVMANMWRDGAACWRAWLSHSKEWRWFPEVWRSGPGMHSLLQSYSTHGLH